MGTLGGYMELLQEGMTHYAQANLAGHVLGVGGICNDTSELARFKIGDSESDRTTHTETKFKEWVERQLLRLKPTNGSLELYLCLTKSPCKRCTTAALRVIAENYGRYFKKMKLGFLNIYMTRQDNKYSFKSESEAGGYYKANLNSAWKVTWFHFREGKLRLVIPVQVTTIVK